MKISIQRTSIRLALLVPEVGVAGSVWGLLRPQDLHHLWTCQPMGGEGGGGEEL